jgi:uncharacterized paraquat-inducible protein A
VHNQSLIFSGENITVETLAKGLRKDFDKWLIAQVMKLFDGHRAQIPALVNDLVKKATPVINDLSDSLLPAFAMKRQQTCRQETPEVDFGSAKLIDWARTEEFPVAKLLNETTAFLSRGLQLRNSYWNLNELISLLTNAQSHEPGVVKLHNAIPPISIKVPKVGTIGLDVHDISIDSLNSFYSLGLLLPARNQGGGGTTPGTVLNSEFELAMSPQDRCRGFYGDTPGAGCGPLNISVQTRLTFKAPDGNAFEDDITLTISLSNVSVALPLNASVDSNILRNLSFGAVVHGQSWKMAHPKEVAQWGSDSVCIGDSINNLSFVSNYEDTNTVNLPLSKWTKTNHLDFASVGLSISDTGQPGKGKGRHLAELMPHIEKLEKVFTKFTNKLLNYYGPYIIPQLLNPLLERMVQRAQNCTGKFPPASADSAASAAYAWSHGADGSSARTVEVGVGLLTMIAAIGFFSHKSYKKRCSGDVEGLNEALLGGDKDDGLDGLRASLSPATGAEFTAAGRWVHMADDAPSFAWPCLLFHRALPTRTRFGVMSALVGLILLSVASNSSTGQSLVITVIFEGEVITVDFMDFSITSVIASMLKCGSTGVLELAVFTATLSLAWPYLKLLLMLVVWLCPVWATSPHARECIMSWIDVLGKLAFFILFVLILMLVSFRITMNLWEEDVVILEINCPIDLLSLCVLGYGAVTAGSLLLASVILNSLRRCEELVHVGATHGGPQEAVCRHVFAKHGRRFKYSAAAAGAVALLLLTAAALIILGGSSPLYEIEFSGLIGAILNVGSSTNVVQFTLLNLASTGGLVIQLAFLCLCFFLPIASIASLLLLWLKPMTLYSQKRVYFLAEILYAWASLDVFIFTALITLTNVRDFAVYLISAPCVPLVPVVEAMPELLALANGDAECFDFNVRLHVGVWILFAAGILAHIASQLVLQSARGALADRLDDAARRVQVQERCKGSQRSLPSCVSAAEACGCVVAFEEEARVGDESDHPRSTMDLHDELHADLRSTNDLGTEPLLGIESTGGEESGVGRPMPGFTLARAPTNQEQL